MFYQWNSMTMLELLQDRGQPLELQVEKTGTGGVRITANGTRTADIPTTDLKKTKRQLSTMLVNYPRQVKINGKAVQREPAPNRAQVSRTDYEGETHTSYRFTQLANPDGVPADGRTQDLLVAGVRMNSGPAMRIAQPRFYAPNEEGGNSYWKPAAVFEARTLLRIPAERISELQTDSHGNLEVPRGSKLHEDLKEQAAASLQQAVEQRVCPQPTSEPVFSRRLAMDYTYEELHDGGAPIIVRGIPVSLEEAHTQGSVFASALAALFEEDQELVPVNRPQANSTDQETRRVAIRKTSADDQKAETKAGAFTAATDTWVEVHLEGESRDRRIPAAAVVTGDNAHTKKVFYVPQRMDPGKMSELLVRAFWTQDDFNNSADPGDALADMQQDFLEEATAAMGDPAAAFRMQMQRTVDQIHRIRPQPDQELTVTSQDGRFRLTWLPAASSDNNAA